MPECYPRSGHVARKIVPRGGRGRGSALLPPFARTPDQRRSRRGSRIAPERRGEVLPSEPEEVVDGAEGPPFDDRDILDGNAVDLAGGPDSPSLRRGGVGELPKNRARGDLALVGRCALGENAPGELHGALSAPIPSTKRRGGSPHEASDPTAPLRELGSSLGGQKGAPGGEGEHERGLDGILGVLPSKAEAPANPGGPGSKRREPERISLCERAVRGAVVGVAKRLPLHGAWRGQARGAGGAGAEDGGRSKALTPRPKKANAPKGNVVKARGCKNHTKVTRFAPTGAGPFAALLALSLSSSGVSRRVGRAEAEKWTFRGRGVNLRIGCDSVAAGFQLRVACSVPPDARPVFVCTLLSFGLRTERAPFSPHRGHADLRSPRYDAPSGTRQSGKVKEQIGPRSDVRREAPRSCWLKRAPWA